MLHALGYWRPTLAVFPTAPASANTPQMQELRKTNPAAFEKASTEARQASAAYTRDHATFDDEAIAAVDKFRADRKLNYQGNPPGLVDARFVDALKSAYLAKTKM